MTIFEYFMVLLSVMLSLALAQLVTGIGELVLIMGPGAEPVLRHLRQLTGATVSWWQRAGGSTALPDPAQVANALQGVQGERVVLIVAADGSLSVIPLVAPQSPGL